MVLDLTKCHLVVEIDEKLSPSGIFLDLLPMVFSNYLVPKTRSLGANLVLFGVYILFVIQFWYYRGRISIRTVNPIIYFTHCRGVCSCLANVVVNAKNFFCVLLFFDSSVFVSCKIYDVFIISQNISFVISAKFWQMCKPLRNWCQMRQNFSRSSGLCCVYCRAQRNLF